MVRFCIEELTVLISRHRPFSCKAARIFGAVCMRDGRWSEIWAGLEWEWCGGRRAGWGGEGVEGRGAGWGENGVGRCRVQGTGWGQVVMGAGQGENMVWHSPGRTQGEDRVAVGRMERVGGDQENRQTWGGGGGAGDGEGG